MGQVGKLKELEVKEDWVETVPSQNDREIALMTSASVAAYKRLQNRASQHPSIEEEGLLHPYHSWLSVIDC